MNMSNALKITNLTKNYGDFTLDNVSFTLPSGCIMGLIGENGAGKSTTIKLILDLIRRDGGEISILGSDLKSGGKRLREQIGVVMDESGFPDNLSAFDIGKILKNCFGTWDSAVFSSYVEKFRLPPRKPVKAYSRGMKMKLSIAVALSHGSRLLILDEATSGLDPIVRDEILDVFLEFIQDETHSILISSHILSDLEKICDFITFIHRGKIVFSEPKDELTQKYVLVKCTPEQYASIDKGAIVGARKNSFGVEALAVKDRLKGDFITDRASVEDIMLYFVKEEIQ
jgi:ABC-2 type transport system ATP-binding protein